MKKEKTWFFSVDEKYKKKLSVEILRNTKQV